MKWKFWQKQNLQNFRKHMIKVIQKIALKDLVLGLSFESEKNKLNLRSMLPGLFPGPELCLSSGFWFWIYVHSPTVCTEERALFVEIYSVTHFSFTACFWTNFCCLRSNILEQNAFIPLCHVTFNGFYCQHAL